MCLLFLFASWVHVFFVSYLRCSGVRDPPFCLAEHPSPSPFASASPGKASRRHTRIATFPMGRKILFY